MSSPPAHRTYGWRTWGDPVREILIGAAVGVAILLVESGGADEFPPMTSFVRNMFLGAGAVIGSRGLETILSWAIEQSRVPTIFRCVIYAFGGWSGYLLGLVFSGMIFGFEDDDFAVGSYHFPYSIALTMTVTILVGMALHHNRKRNDRLRKTVERLKEHEFAEKELEIAREMQQRLLPPPLIERDGYRITARTEAAHIVGGDFYDVLPLNDGSIAVIAADVAGKGIAASLLMASCKAMIPFLAASGDTAEVMGALNQSLCDQLQRREFVAMIFARLDPETGALQIVNAGMPDPVLIANGSTRTIVALGERLPLGSRRANRYQSVQATLGSGERLLLFSDGLAEAKSGEGQVGYERVESMAISSRTADELLARLHAIQGIEVQDDVTVVVVERLSAV